MKKFSGNLLSLLNLHIAGVALLLILNLVLGRAPLSCLEYVARRRPASNFSSGRPRTARCSWR